jgi:hypothetical protein
LPEPDEPPEPPDVPELEPLELVTLPELDALPEEEPAASLSGEPSLVELPLPHAPAIAARHTMHPVSAEWRRTPLVTLSMSMPPWQWHQAPQSVTSREARPPSGNVRLRQTVDDQQVEDRLCNGFLAEPPLRWR